MTFAPGGGLIACKLPRGVDATPAGRCCAPVGLRSPAAPRPLPRRVITPVPAGPWRRGGWPGRRFTYHRPRSTQVLREFSRAPGPGPVARSRGARAGYVLTVPSASLTCGHAVCPARRCNVAGRSAATPTGRTVALRSRPAVAASRASRRPRRSDHSDPPHLADAVIERVGDIRLPPRRAPARGCPCAPRPSAAPRSDSPVPAAVLRCRGRDAAMRVKCVRR